MRTRRSVLFLTAAATLSWPLRATANFDFGSLPNMAPGSVVTLPPGTYPDDTVIELNGAPGQSVTVKAAIPHQSVFTGAVTLTGSYGIVDGLRFQGPVSVEGTANTIANSRHDSGNGFAIRLRTGPAHRVMNALIEDWTGAGIAIDGGTTGSLVRNCLLRNAAGPRVNGREAMRVGVGKNDAYKNINATVERCRISNWNTDDEAISVKSSNNLIKHVTVEDCDGRVQNRYGRNNRYEGLWLRRTRHLRIHDEDCQVLGCVIQQSTADGLLIGTGDVPPGDIIVNGTAGHPYANNTTIAGCVADNIIIGDAWPGDDLPALNTLLRLHKGPVSLGTEASSDIAPTQPLAVSYAKAVYLGDGAVGPFAEPVPDIRRVPASRRRPVRAQNPRRPAKPRVPRKKRPNRGQRS